VQLLFGYGQSFFVGRVDDEAGRECVSRRGSASWRLTNSHDGVHAAAIPFPHRSKSGLASEIPTTILSAPSPNPPTPWLHSTRAGRHLPLQSDMALLDALHVEPDRGYRAARCTSVGFHHHRRFASRLHRLAWSHILDGELATLLRNISFWDNATTQSGHWDGHTASTRKSDVLPAF